MEDDELGMNLFNLGDDYDGYEDSDEINPNDHINIDLEEDDDESSEKDTNDEPNEDENLEGVVGDDTEDEDDNQDQNTDEKSSPPLYKSLASVLHERGVLSSVDSSKLEKVESIEDLNALIEEESNARRYKDLTPEQEDYLKALEAGIDDNTYKQQKQTERQLDNITEEELTSNEDLRREVIFQSFINQGFSEQKAERFTTRSFESDDDVEDAKEALETIKESVKEKFKAQIEYEKAEKVKTEKSFKDTQDKLKKQILETEEPFKGLKLNDNARKKVLDTMFIPISKNPITGAEENALMKDQRENEDFSRKLYTVYTLTNGFNDFSYFGKNEKSKANSDFEKALKNNKNLIIGGGNAKIDDIDDDGFEIGDTIRY